MKRYSIFIKLKIKTSISRTIIIQLNLLAIFLIQTCQFRFFNFFKYLYQYQQMLLFYNMFFLIFLFLQTCLQNQNKFNLMFTSESNIRISINKNLNEMKIMELFGKLLETKELILNQINKNMVFEYKQQKVLVKIIKLQFIEKVRDFMGNNIEIDKDQLDIIDRVYIYKFND
ncbi:unnamed protein product [Paramecium sonneborni]|uniref:Transmembrane protein n=1 Tax=Paramecium sonneborni TaxID=65129 RepID=A0A8S1RIV9_9CILI|nr:unnamed protein product [Paramecium sonneborni]